MPGTATAGESRPHYTLAWAYQKVTDREANTPDSFCPPGASNYLAYDGEFREPYWRLRVQCIGVGAKSDALLREATWEVFEADGQVALEAQDEFGDLGLRCADAPNRCITVNRLALAVPTPAPSPTPQCSKNDVNVAKQSAVRIEWSDSRYTYTGSGFLLDAQTIVTNRHVVEGTSLVSLQFADGSTGRGSVIGVSKRLDLAVVRPDRAPAGVGLRWGDSTSLDGAEDVWAIGFPKSLDGPPIITKGTVSRVFIEDGVEYVQTDAAVNPGNSGGALVDECGRVVGVVTAKYTNAEGLGFAQSQAIVSPEVEVLRRGGGNTPAAPTLPPAPRCTAADPRQCPITGEWTVTDTVTFGPDAGKSFTFTLLVAESNGQVAGTTPDTELTFTGRRTGNQIRVDFHRTGGSGYFSWTLGADGGLTGTYEDYGAKNGGTTVAVRK